MSVLLAAIWQDRMQENLPKRQSVALDSEY